MLKPSFMVGRILALTAVDADREGGMARIEPLSVHEVDGEIRHLCEEAERRVGTSASTRTYAKNPAVLKALSTFRATLARDGTLDPVLRELVRLKIAALNRCRY
jgi:alkylhydroperoxidase family enzyme